MTISTSRRIQAIAGAGLLVIGGAAGAGIGHALKPSIEMAPLHPATIRSLAQQSGIVSVRGRVAETFGKNFVADDGTGRTLVDLGPAGDEVALVALGQIVTVQGRFDRGVLHASFLVDGAGNVRAIGPGDHPPRPRRGPPPSPPMPGAPDAPNGRDGAPPPAA